MLEHAEVKGLTVVILGDYRLNPFPHQVYVHAEYKEIREMILNKLNWEEGSQDALLIDYVGRYEGRYVYKQDISPDGRPLIGSMTCIFDKDSCEYLHETQFVVEAKAARTP